LASVVVDFAVRRMETLLLACVQLSRSIAGNRRRPLPSVWCGKMKVFLFALAALILAGNRVASGTVVRGNIASADGQPAAHYQINLENKVTGVLYLVETASDGSFSLDVPPGNYNLRERDGTVLKSGITVKLDPVDIGTAYIPTRNSFWRFFQRIRVAPAIVNSPAPVTAEASPGKQLPKATVLSSAPVSPSSPSPSSSRTMRENRPIESEAGTSPSYPSTFSDVSRMSSQEQNVRAQDDIPPPAAPQYVPRKSVLSLPGVQ